MFLYSLLQRISSLQNRDYLIVLYRPIELGWLPENHVAEFL